MLLDIFSRIAEYFADYLNILVPRQFGTSNAAVVRHNPRTLAYSYTRMSDLVVGSTTSPAHDIFTEWPLIAPADAIFYIKYYYAKKKSIHDIIRDD